MLEFWSGSSGGVQFQLYFYFQILFLILTIVTVAPKETPKKINNEAKVTLALLYCNNILRTTPFYRDNQLKNHCLAKVAIVGTQFCVRDLKKGMNESKLKNYDCVYQFGIASVISITRVLK